MIKLRKLFGPSKKEIWRQLCAEIGADYVQGGFWKGDKVQATHAEWTITPDTFAVSNGQSHHRLHTTASALRQPRPFPIHHLPSWTFQRHRQVARYAGHRGWPLRLRPG